MLFADWLVSFSLQPSLCFRLDAKFEYENGGTVRPTLHFSLNDNDFLKTISIIMPSKVRVSICNDEN